MTIAGYRITQVKTIPRLLKEHGYQIWYWPVRGSALNCPLEPLTPEFWREKRRVRLMFGNFLPAIRKPDRGDLIILLTQSLRQSRGFSYGDLTTEEAITWYDFLLREFLRVTNLDRTPVQLTESLIGKFEKVFELHILPTRNEKGKYHRHLTISYVGNILPIDVRGMFRCPRCRQAVSVYSALDVLDKYYAKDGTIFLFFVCSRCGEMMQLSIDSPNRWRLDKNANRHILSIYSLPRLEDLSPSSTPEYGSLYAKRSRKLVP